MKMIVVEDEEILRNGICSVGKWESYGIHISGMAKNGLEALEMVKKECPDIILTDVVMPLMDGIELTRELYLQYPQIKVIILSGHEEFEFAKSAIEYKASRYLLKPARIEKIVEAVCEIKEEIEKERLKESEVNRVKEKLKKSMPVLREHYLKQIVLTGIRDIEEAESQLNFYDLNISVNNIGVMNLEFDEKKVSIDERSLRVLCLRNICVKILKNQCRYAIFQKDVDQVVIIINYNEDILMKDALNYLIGKALSIQKEAMSDLNETISVGIGRLKSNISEINKAYYEAEMALSHKFFMGDGSVIYIGDVFHEEANDPHYLEQIKLEILMHLRAGNKEQTVEHLNKYFSELERYSNKGSMFVRDELVVLIHDVFRTVDDKGLENSNLSKLQKKLVSDLGLYEDTTLPYMEERFVEIVIELIEEINKCRQIRNKGIVDEAMEYIRNNLNKDISLITVADRVYISPNYLSYLFKEEGENFRDFIIRVKMEKAKELLESGRYNNNQIAYKLGYSDGRYFYQAYKKYYEKLK
jgi:two-component system response regulator YesN